MKLNNFTHQYPISKTLRFELKPVGETADYIEDFKSQYLKDIVTQDEQRAEDYKIIKEIIDDYHRDYIEEKLSNPCDPKTGELFISEEDFENAYSYFENFRKISKDEKAKKNWVDTQTGLRKKLVKAFIGNARLFSKELIKEDLENWLKQKGEWDEHKDVVTNFKKFTTYFTGFHENRKNIYSAEEQSTAISHRLMNENLIFFFKNCVQYKSVINKYPDFSFSLENELMKKMNVNTLQEVFHPGYFVNLFTQSGIDLFNECLGGRTTDKGEKIQGLNETINFYRQKKSLKKRELPNFIGLYKQILSDRESSSFIPVAFESDKELLDALEKLFEEMSDSNGLLSRLEKSISHLQESDLEKTYVKGGINLRSMSQNIYKSHFIVNNAVTHHVESILFRAPKSGKVSEALEEKRKKYVNNHEAFSIGELETMISNYSLSLDDDHEDKNILSDKTHPILNHFLNAIHDVKNDEEIQFEQSIRMVKSLFSLEVLNSGKKGADQKQQIQKALDAFLAIIHAVKPLHLVKGRKPLDLPDIDMGFYAEFLEQFNTCESLIIGLYNKTRNHLTKKPFSTDKIKINFENPTFLVGWDYNQAKGNNANILRKNGMYYLAIMHPEHNKIFDDHPEDESGESFERINYKLIPNINRMLPKVFFSKKGIENFGPSKEILDIYKNGEHKKGSSFNLNSCHKLIDFFKENIGKYKANPGDKFGWEVFNFQFSETESYKDISYFYTELENQAYKLWFSTISETYINQCIKEGKLYLFQIYNKDFSTFSSGKPNLHTLYWKALFDLNNLKNVVAKLNGEAEMFYRKHSIKKDDRIIHHKDKTLHNKNENNPKKESVFEYDIIKDKRYTVDKFHFHAPITLNFKAKGITRFNDGMNKMIADSHDTHVIGIDRGERHLLYYTVINPQGSIVEQGSFNTIKTDQNYEVDYRQKLDEKEKARDEARKSWTTVENIKELKAGYLSHVIHKLALLIVKYDAIVCLEDLNYGFKRGRFKVEKQVYQKFEKALIDKLNYLVFKDAKPNEPGHVLNALQLTAPFVSFKKLGKQTGMLYYVPASYTSKIDPNTGYMNFLYTRYESLPKSKRFFETMDDIRYNADKGYFEYSFDYSKTNPDRDLSGYQTKWTICTHGDLRYKNQRNVHGNFESIPVNVTEEMKALFEKHGISYQNGGDLREQIALAKNSNFYRKLYKLLFVTVSLRHSKTGTDEDFILSPVADENGHFFDSRTASKTLPRDADANGAYHIALKGLWNIQKIKKWDGESKLDLYMKNVDWFSFALQKPFKK